MVVRRQVKKRLQRQRRERPRLLSNFKTMLSTKTTVKRALPKEYCQKACLKQALCSNGAD